MRRLTTGLRNQKNKLNKAKPRKSLNKKLRSRCKNRFLSSKREIVIPRISKPRSLNKKVSIIQSELNNYSYLPKEDTIAKLKYYYGPYNQVKGFRKYMDLPKGFECTENKNSNELWENISSYILNDKEGTLRKLPFNLEQYTEPAYPPIVPATVDEEWSQKKKKKRKAASMCIPEPKQNEIDQNINFTLDPGFRNVKDLSPLLTPVNRRARYQNKNNVSFSQQTEQWFDRLNSGLSTLNTEVEFGTLEPKRSTRIFTRCENRPSK